jgi:hypothetical protein
MHVIVARKCFRVAREWFAMDYFTRRGGVSLILLFCSPLGFWKQGVQNVSFPKGLREEKK